ncbi:hypothetical protein KP509_1Z323400 [Ceratopteris richardii]|nr:hypothetical protein KP509_1Z323400 [Ceratopteris richardii]
MILVSCVSGAQLSNYATFLVEQEMAPLSIVMTAISTATAVFVTPALTSLLLGKRLPVDFWGMVVNITQIVVAPIATGIVLNSLIIFEGHIMRCKNCLDVGEKYYKDHEHN